MKVLVAVVLIAFSCVTADAQGTSDVIDFGHMPSIRRRGDSRRVRCRVTNKATPARKFSAVTSGAGTFTVPSLDTGVPTP
jgi:hypothetical protein